MLLFLPFGSVAIMGGALRKAASGGDGDESGSVVVTKSVFKRGKRSRPVAVAMTDEELDAVEEEQARR